MIFSQRAWQVVLATGVALSFTTAAWSQAAPCITSSTGLVGSGCAYASSGENRYVNPNVQFGSGFPVPWFNPADGEGSTVFLTSFNLGNFEAFPAVGVQIETGPFAGLTPELGQIHGTFDLSFRLGTLSTVVHSFNGVYVTDGGVVGSNWLYGPGITMDSLSPVDPDLPQDWGLRFTPGKSLPTELTRTDLGSGLYRFDHSYDLYTDFTWDRGLHWLPFAPDGEPMHVELIGGPVAAIPEPEAYALLMAGLGLLAVARRRRR